MKHIRKFNESNGEVTEDQKVKVKHLIEYLQSFDPETNVSLDKDGWDYYYGNPIEVIKHSGVFHPFEYDGKKTLYINN